jgi:hypothetical protein
LRKSKALAKIECAIKRNGPDALEMALTSPPSEFMFASMFPNYKKQIKKVNTRDIGC